MLVIAAKEKAVENTKTAGTIGVSEDDKYLRSNLT